MFKPRGILLNEKVGVAGRPGRKSRILVSLTCGLNKCAEIGSIYFFYVSVLVLVSYFRYFVSTFSLFLSTNHVTYISFSIILNVVTVLSIYT